MVSKAVNNETHKKHGHRKKLIIWGIILAVIVILVFCAFYTGLVLRRYEIRSVKITSHDTIRIVAIADMHSHIYGSDQQPLIDMIEAQQPDIIALVGDIVDDHQSELGAELFLEGIADIAPVYYVSGNHEYWSGEYERIKNMIAGYGVTVLSNERVYITVKGIDFCICGIDDPEIFEYTNDRQLLDMENEDDILRRFADLDNSDVKILLAHRPERIESYLNYDFDLILSGHAHGGQIRIPLILNGLFAPDQGYFPEYAGGQYTFDDQTMIVSRGLSYNSRLPRVFNPPEVVVVDITGESDM